MKTKKRVIPALVLSLFAAFGSAESNAAQFSNVYVFGDSLSDAGYYRGYLRAVVSSPLIETDQAFGHRKDVEGFHGALRALDGYVAGALERRLDVGVFDHLPGVHDRDPVGGLGHHAQIVGDQQDAHA